MPATRSHSPARPFEHLNLRWNPFRTLEPDEAAQAAVPAFDPGVARLLLRPRRAVQLTGPCGAGKTTHLHALRGSVLASVPDSPYVYFGPDHTPPVPDSRVVFVDELQRLPRRGRMRLFRRRGTSFVIGSHRDHTAELRLAGVELLRGVELAPSSPERLHALLDRRVELARRGPGPVPRITAAAARRLLARHGGDVRAIIDHLYDVFQTLEAPRHVHEV